jgi:hypothetical protein
MWDLGIGHKQVGKSSGEFQVMEWFRILSLKSFHGFVIVSCLCLPLGQVEQRHVTVSFGALDLPGSRVGGEPFYASWLPADFSPVPHELNIFRDVWQTASGKRGSVDVIESAIYLEESPRKSEIYFTVVIASQYPSGYWTSYLDSPDYRHFHERRSTVIYSTDSRGDVTAMTENQGFIISVSGVNVSARSVVIFSQNLRLAKDAKEF